MVYFYEDKATVVNMLFQTLKQTVAGVGLQEMRYEMLNDYNEIVVLIYEDGYRKSVNVSCDSGIVLMRDVLRAME